MDIDDYRQILSLDSIAVGVVSQSGTVEWVSPGLQRMIGPSSDVAVGSRVSAWFGDTGPFSLDDLESADAGVKWDTTLKSGSAGPMRVQVEVERLASRQSSWALVLTSVHEREERFARLARNELMARLCIDLIDQAVLLVSPTLGIEHANPALRTILGYEPSELFELWSNPSWSVHDADALPMVRADFAPMRAVSTGEAVRDEINWIRHADGHWVRVRLSAYPFAWTDEVVVAMTDITEYTTATAPRPPQ